MNDLVSQLKKQRVSSPALTKRKKKLVYNEATAHLMTSEEQQGMKQSKMHKTTVSLYQDAPRNTGKR